MTTIKFVCGKDSFCTKTTYYRQKIIYVTPKTLQLNRVRPFVITDKIGVDFNEQNVFRFGSVSCFPNFYLTFNTIDGKNGVTSVENSSEIKSIVLEHRDNFTSKDKINKYKKDIESLKGDRDVVLELIEAKGMNNLEYCKHLMINYEILFDLRTYEEIYAKIKSINERISALLVEINNIFKNE